MSTAAAPPVTGATKWALIGTVLLAALLYTLTAKGTALDANVVIQAVDLDYYKAQWVSGPTGVAGLVAIFSSIYLVQVFGARRVFLLGAVCLTAGAVGGAMMRTGWQDGVSSVVGGGA